MINSWLQCEEQINKGYVFRLIQITEIGLPDESLINFLQEEIITSYRSLDFYTFYYEGTVLEDDIRKYIKEQVIPKDENQFDKNVRQGDWGEILSGLIVSYFQDLTIPINKLRWKFNKDKAVFGTDLIAFNKGDSISDIYYYEIKTRLNPNQKEGKMPNRHYISILAHNSLLKDEESPTESIADFLVRLYFEKGDFITASKFRDITINPQNYNKKFELFLIVEKGNFIEDVLRDLNDLPPQLSILSVTVILIENLGSLVTRTWNVIENVIINKIIKK